MAIVPFSCLGVQTVIRGIFIEYFRNNVIASNYRIVNLFASTPFISFLASLFYFFLNRDLIPQYNHYRKTH